MTIQRIRFAALLSGALLVFSMSAGETFGAEKTGGPESVHVAVQGSDETGDGTEELPFATITHAAESFPASSIVVHEGIYEPVRLDSGCSGRPDSPTFIYAPEGEKAVIRAEDGACILITDADYITIENLETEGGTHGIDYESTREAGTQPLEDITIRGCRVHGVRGTHGICVYARNDLAPVTNLSVEDCEIYDCECGSSESLVLNGNVDGFLISGNVIHDNNNIGIDMIGFEGPAMHPDESDGRNPYEADFVRNGVCRDNIVYNISSEGNPAYFEDGEYDLCADGIYVDGGQEIEIFNNFIFRCNIGLEVATEHSPEDNDLFRVTGIRVHDNIIADSTGWIGMCLGGYDRDLGFTENCEFSHNTLVDNISHIGIQRSRNNLITANLLLGGETGVEFSEECDPEDMVNDIRENACAEIEDEESWSSEYGKMYADRSEISEGFRSLDENVGSRFIPDEHALEIYESHGNSSVIYGI